MTSPTRLQFFFGLRSPYAWLAQRLVAAHVAPPDQDRIDWIPYWDPDSDTQEALKSSGANILYRPMSRERHLYILGDLKRTARRLGYPLRWPVDAPDMRWQPVHVACIAAENQGKGAALRSALFTARWEEGHDICDSGVLSGLLAANGVTLPSDEHSTAALQAQAVACLRLAYDKGTFGLPYFCVGRERFWGVDRLGFALAEAGIDSDALVAAWNRLPHAAALAP